jgi:hypothetical protein
MHPDVSVMRTFRVEHEDQEYGTDDGKIVIEVKRM